MHKEAPDKGFAAAETTTAKRRKASLSLLCRHDIITKINGPRWWGSWLVLKHCFWASPQFTGFLTQEAQNLITEAEMKLDETFHVPSLRHIWLHLIPQSQTLFSQKHKDDNADGGWCDRNVLVRDQTKTECSVVQDAQAACENHDLPKEMPCEQQQFLVASDFCSFFHLLAVCVSCWQISVSNN